MPTAPHRVHCLPGSSPARPGATSGPSPGGAGSGIPVIASSASHRSGTAPPHLRAGTGASRPRCELRAVARAAPTSPPPLRSPGTRTPPAYGSSGPHPCGCRSLPRRVVPQRLTWPGCSPAGRVSAPSCSSGSLVDRNELIRDSAGHPHAATPGQGPGAIPNCPMPVALKMVLQIAARNIGQLTDIEPSPPPLPGSRQLGTTPASGEGQVPILPSSPDDRLLVVLP